MNQLEKHAAAARVQRIVGRRSFLSIKKPLVPLASNELLYRAPEGVLVFTSSQIASHGRSDGLGIDVLVDAIRCCKPVGQRFLASARVARSTTKYDIVRLQLWPVKRRVEIQVFNRCATRAVLGGIGVNHLLRAIHTCRVARPNS
jgi:hypothetical protein